MRWWRLRTWARFTFSARERAVWRHRLRMRWWRLRTWARFAFSARERAVWRQCFAIEPCLFNARHYRDYATMAGFYNDTIPCGFMTPEDARRIATEDRK